MPVKIAPGGSKNEKIGSTRYNFVRPRGLRGRIRRVIIVQPISPIPSCGSDSDNRRFLYESNWFDSGYGLAKSCIKSGCFAGSIAAATAASFCYFFAPSYTEFSVGIACALGFVAACLAISGRG